MSREKKREKGWAYGTKVSTTNPPPPSCSLPDTPTTLSQVLPTPTRSLLPKSEAPRVSFAKTEPQRLSCDFWPQQVPPSRVTQSHPLTTSNLVYPTPFRFPLPKSEAPCVSFAKTEPRRLGFGLLAPSCTLVDPCLPASQPRCTPPQMCPQHPNSSPSALR